MSDKVVKIDEVSRNQIWREQLKKEYNMESPLTPFQINPKTISAVSMKPTITHPSDFGKSPREDNNEIANKVIEASQKVLDRSKLPLTESQRVGWLHAAALQGIEGDLQRRMFKGRESCDVTQFADSYCTMAGCSPFADKST